MRDIDIKWKQTTSKKLRCSLCKKNMNNIEGFISLKEWYPYILINVCWNCFQKIIEKRGTQEQRKEKYLLLTKKRMLRELK